MKRLMIALALVACQSTSEEKAQAEKHASEWSRVRDGDLEVVHDKKRAVTCWLSHSAYSTGISCLPDSAVHREPTP